MRISDEHFLQTAGAPAGFVLPHRLTGLPPDTPLLVGFSGGADSRLLLALCISYAGVYGCTVYAAHLHHGIRGEEADRDLAFCVRTAEDAGIRLFTARADVPAQAAASGQSLELAAREARYAFFASTLKAIAAARDDRRMPVLLTAHHADDQLETVLLRLLRGTGIRGMSGIPPVRRFGETLIARPLLTCTKADILTACAHLHLDYVTDSTNGGDDGTRNRLRHRVIPLLEDIAGEGVPQRSAARLTAAAREDDRYLTEQAQAAYRSIRLPTGAGLPIAALCALPPAISHRVMRLAYRDAVNAFPDACSDDGINMNTDTDTLPSDRTLTAAHLAAIDALCTAAVPHSQAPLPYGWRAVCRPADADRLLCFAPPEEADDRPADALPPQTLQEGDNPWGKTVIRIEHLPAPASPLDGDGVLASVVLPAEALPLPLTVRPRRAGDRILCHGMHKKLKKLICDKHIPPSEREALPVICHPAQADGGTVLWVPAVAVCDGYPPPQSGGALRITVLRTL